MRRLVCFFVFMVLLASRMYAQELKNDTIIKMIGDGVGEDAVVALINTQGGSWELTADAITKLNTAKVSPKVIAAMVATRKPAAANGEELKNDTIIKMIGDGVGEDAVVALINTQGGSWELTAHAITKLNTAKVSPKVIAAMVATRKPAIPTPAVAIPEPAYHGFSVADLTTPFIGTGWLMTAHGTDYKILQSANVIEATGLGHKTPDFLLGVAFNTLLRPAFWKGRLDSSIDRPYDPHVDAFVSLKFTPSSQNTINGFVFGGAVRLHPNLDFVVGVALTPQSAPSVGFRNTAYLAVTGQPDDYAAFVGKTKDILLNRNQGFDGFPLLKPDGNPLYAGEPLTMQYRNGIFVGIAFPLSLGSLFKPAATTTPEPAKETADTNATKTAGTTVRK